MAKVLPLLALVLCAATKYNLPIEVMCNGVAVQAKGAFICAQKAPPVSLRVKIPPTRGQLRVVDCSQDLTRDGNPDDFNVTTYKTGWWLWARTIRLLDRSPAFNFPSKSYQDCGITASVTGEKAGTQSARLVFEPRDFQDFALVGCAGKAPAATVRGVGLCIALQGSEITFATATKAGTLIAIGSECGFNQRSELGEPIKMQLPLGACVVDLAQVTAYGSQRARILVVGHNRATRELDSPFMIKDGNGVRVFRPLGATLISTELYAGGKTIFRSGERQDESYTLDPRSDNQPNSTSWPAGTIACHTAYSDTLQSISGTCYDVNSLTEVPYFFD